MQIQPNIVEIYFNMLQNLSAENKKALAEKLLDEASKVQETPKPKSIHDLYGAWEDDRTAEEIIEDIYKGRFSTRIIEPM
jgi:hypothetical protein